MHYLQRDERREGIMQAAMRLLRGGFSAMTVRQIAREAQVAAEPCTTTSPSAS